MQEDDEFIRQLLEGLIDRLVARVKAEGHHPEDYDDETWAAMVEAEFDRA